MFPGWTGTNDCLSYENDTTYQEPEFFPSNFSCGIAESRFQYFLLEVVDWIFCDGQELAYPSGRVNCGER